MLAGSILCSFTVGGSAPDVELALQYIWEDVKTMELTFDGMTVPVKQQMLVENQPYRGDDEVGYQGDR